VIGFDSIVNRNSNVLGATNLNSTANITGVTNVASSFSAGLTNLQSLNVTTTSNIVGATTIVGTMNIQSTTNVNSAFSALGQGIFGGNLGVFCNTAPTRTLDVLGSAVLGSAAERLILNSTYIGFNRDPIAAVNYTASAFAYQLNHTQSTTSTSDYLAIQVYNQSGVSVSAIGFVINGSGNVGIGIQPSNKLDVAGGIAISGTTVIDSSRNLTNIVAVGCGAITSTSTISGTTLYGPIAGSNTIAASTITATNLIGTTIYGTIAGANNITCSTLSGTTLYGTLAGSNTIACSSLTSGGTIQTSYQQGSNAPNAGQAYFYNPANSTNQDSSCAVRIAGGSARYAYYSYDCSGVAGFSHGILGSSQNLVFRASWDMSTGTLFTMDRSGNFTATGSVACNSDARFKTDLQPIENAIEKVKKVTGYTYDRTDIKLPRQVGVLAQDMLEVLPEVVNLGDDGFYTVSYGNITALLIQALKEETAKREALELRLSRFEEFFELAHKGL